MYVGLSQLLKTVGCDTLMVSEIGEKKLQTGELEKPVQFPANRSMELLDVASKLLREERRFIDL